jgi:hypothetical protein
VLCWCDAQHTWMALAALSLFIHNNNKHSHTAITNGPVRTARSAVRSSDHYGPDRLVPSGPSVLMAQQAENHQRHKYSAFVIKICVFSDQGRGALALVKDSFRRMGRPILSYFTSPLACFGSAR